MFRVIKQTELWGQVHSDPGLVPDLKAPSTDIDLFRWLNVAAADRHLLYVIH